MTDVRTLLLQVRSDPELARRQLGGPPLLPALTEFIAGSQAAPIPDAVRELAKLHLLDTLAAIVVNAELGPSRLALRFVREHGGAASAAPILGTAFRAPLLDAIFASAMTAHASEINDFCPSAFVQPGPPVVSAVMCCADAWRASGEQALRAVVAGYELCCRVPKALGIENLQRAGLSSHGVGPTFGTAAALASLLGLPREKIGHVLSYCVQQASGSYQWLRDVEHIEKAFLFSAMPARNGAYAALLVREGFSGVPDPFEGAPSFLISGTYLGKDSDLDRAQLVDGLGERFELPLVAFKRYPVGGPAQPGVEGVLGLVADLRDRGRVAHVRIEMPGRADAFANAAMPALNLRYLTALILLDGRLDFQAAQSLERMHGDAAVQARMECVQVVHDPWQERTPRVESARVTLTLTDGSRRETFIEHVLGFPEHPMGRSDVTEKAFALLKQPLGSKRARALIDLVLHLEDVTDMRSIVDALTPAQST